MIYSKLQEPTFNNICASQHVLLRSMHKITPLFKERSTILKVILHQLNAKLSSGVLSVIAINAYQRDKLERPCCNHNGGALSPFKTPGVSMVCIPFAHGMLCITFKWNLYDLRVWSTLSEKKI